MVEVVSPALVPQLTMKQLERRQRGLSLVGTLFESVIISALSNDFFFFTSLRVVANIAFETTEEQLRPILCEVGPVVSLK
jgi:predicted MFS family arabinose efflux permease